MTQSIHHHVNNLNEEQQEAVRHKNGPLLILAGAGTGKTKTLTSRIAWLMLEHNIDPHHILAVTFTNKAASEMKERVTQLLADSHLQTPPFIGTFHSLGARILRRHAEAIGLKSNFIILDDDDQLRLIKNIMDDLGLDRKKIPERLVAATIDQWKNRALTPSELDEDDHNRLYRKGHDLYRTYQERLFAMNSCDFGDLILHVITLLRRNEEIATLWQKQFEHILVDEYQDTNGAQYLWLRALLGHHHNICCVGDDDQSIYGWRGAQVTNILHFERNFEDAHIIRLERNYRSSHAILKAAGGIINENRARLGKELWTAQNEGDKVLVRHFWDSGHEAAAIAHSIQMLKMSDRPLNDIAVLVRTSAQLRELEEALIERRIDYRIIGGMRFYERREIRDALAYLRLINEDSDDLALQRIINLPRRGIGSTTMNALKQYALEHKCSLCTAIKECVTHNHVSQSVARKLQLFHNALVHWQEAAASMKPEQLAHLLLEESGYYAMLKNSAEEKDKNRLDNLGELITAISHHATIADFLEHVSLVTEMETPTQQQEAVQLMTLHAAKGLEFHVVFLPGWEEGLFPHQRVLNESGENGLEEERRLAYVGITRARSQLTISAAARRRLYGHWMDCLPSRFLKNLPDDVTEVLSDRTARANVPSMSALTWHHE